jgi:coenzyme PQQ precursor peptide PqqA
MQWTKPEFEVISLNMEVTAYVNSDDNVAGQVTREIVVQHNSDQPREGSQ